MYLVPMTTTGQSKGFDKPSKDPNCWIAPEHLFVALYMERRRGELIIEPNPIFAYSRRNPPPHVPGNFRIRVLK